MISTIIVLIVLILYFIGVIVMYIYIDKSDFHVMEPWIDKVVISFLWPIMMLIIIPMDIFYYWRRRK